MNHIELDLTDSEIETLIITLEHAIQSLKKKYEQESKTQQILLEDIKTCLENELARFWY